MSKEKNFVIEMNCILPDIQRKRFILKFCLGFLMLRVLLSGRTYFSILYFLFDFFVLSIEIKLQTFKNNFLFFFMP